MKKYGPPKASRKERGGSRDAWNSHPPGKDRSKSKKAQRKGYKKRSKR